MPDERMREGLEGATVERSRLGRATLHPSSLWQALDAEAALWAEETYLQDWINRLTSDARTREKVDAIARLCFEEGFYRGALAASQGRALADSIADAARLAAVTSEPELKADMLRVLPGHVLDDATYEAVESALDRAEAPCTGPDSRWLKLHERVAALASAMEAQRAETEGLGAKPDSAAGDSRDAQPQPPENTGKFPSPSEHQDGGWRDIASAPRDGTVIIIPGGIGYWDGECWRTLTACAFPGLEIQWPVLVWMPLPPPPQGAGGAA